MYAIGYEVYSIGNTKKRIFLEYVVPEKKCCTFNDITMVKNIMKSIFTTDKDYNKFSLENKQHLLSFYNHAYKDWNTWGQKCYATLREHEDKVVHIFVLSHIDLKIELKEYGAKWLWT